MTDDEIDGNIKEKDNSDLDKNEESEQSSNVTHDFVETSVNIDFGYSGSGYDSDITERFNTSLMPKHREKLKRISDVTGKPVSFLLYILVDDGIEDLMDDAAIQSYMEKTRRDRNLDEVTWLDDLKEFYDNLDEEEDDLKFFINRESIGKIRRFVNRYKGLLNLVRRKKGRSDMYKKYLDRRTPDIEGKLEELIEMCEEGLDKIFGVGGD